MQFNSKRREFLKWGAASLSYPLIPNTLRLALVAESLHVADSHAAVCSLISVDATIYSVDSTLINVSYGFSLFDSDCDGLRDNAENRRYATDPLLVDTDGDTINDGIEVLVYGTNPLSMDTDGDGYTDDEEILFFSDPLDPDSRPGIADGDVNLDGKVDAGDMTVLNDIVLGDGAHSPAQLQHADVAPLINGVPSPDGKLDTGDIVVLTRKVLGQISF